jgi:hypothetical protein
VLLWKQGNLIEAVEAMRLARAAMPVNTRVLFNCAHIMIAALKANPDHPDLAAEAKEVLLQVDQLAPNQKRFAQLMEQLVALTPKAVDELLNEPEILLL